LYRAVHEAPDLSRLPHGLHELVRPCLAKNPDDRPSTAWLIEAARRHSATGGELRFTDGWLPPQVDNDIHRHTDLPSTPLPPATILNPARADAPTAHILHTPAPTLLQPGSTSDTAATTRRRRTRIALVAGLALLVGAAATFILLNTYYFDDPDDQNTLATASRPPSAGTTTSAGANPSSRSKSPQPTTVSGYTAAYTTLELTSPDGDYEFDLKAGKVTQNTSSWYLGREAGAFYIPDDSDAYIAPASPLTLHECLEGIDTQPSSTLPFTTVGADRSFCVRSHGGQDIAIIRTLTTASDDGPVTVSITYYRRSA
ncbi:hypothetical protein ACFV4K_20100, partial [Nocardia sp. NPDC059764]